MCEDRARKAHLAHGARDQGRPLNTYSPDISASNLSLYLKMLFSSGFSFTVVFASYLAV